MPPREGGLSDRRARPAADLLSGDTDGNGATDIVIRVEGVTSLAVADLQF